MKPECIKMKADADHHLENPDAQSEIQTADQTGQPPTIEIEKWTQPQPQRRPQPQSHQHPDQHLPQVHNQKALTPLRIHTPGDNNHPPQQEEDKLRVRQPRLLTDLDQSHTPEMPPGAEIETEIETETDLVHKTAMTELRHPDQEPNPDLTQPEARTISPAQARRPLSSQ